MTYNSFKRAALIGLFGLLLLALFLAAGCSNRVTGTQKANQKPVAYFVNIPPDGSTSSRNPLVYWIGTDPDGLVRAYRYIVVKESDMGGSTPQEYSATFSNLSDSAFAHLGGTILKVDDSLPNTQTQAVVNMSADLNDPVNTYVNQYIFLQAKDDQGAYSDVAFRLLRRNDNPPTTTVTFLGYDENLSPFINSVSSGGVITGVRFKLDGNDPDYPVNPPPFQFQWKLFGPYDTDTITGGEYQQMLDLVMDTVFVGNDGKVYPFGEGKFMVFYCDSIDSVNDTVIQIPCDTLFIDTITRDNLFGHIKLLANIDDTTFTHSALYRPVDSSNGWVSSAYDTVYNVYRNAPSNTTIQRRFALWARCRDDAFVADLTPAFSPCGVIEPKYERDLLVIDFDKASSGARINSPLTGPRTAFTTDTAAQFWKRQIARWNPAVSFDSVDFIKLNAAPYNESISLVPFLQHKVVILFNDDVILSGYYGLTGALSDAALKTVKAVDAGVNVWFCMRCGFTGNEGTPPVFFRPDAVFQLFFGVDSVRFTGWLAYANIVNPDEQPGQRIEDFIGAYPLQPGWPPVSVDTANLHHRYKWTDDYNNHINWNDSLHALPEVGWAFRHRGTEPLYLYKSLYGAVHPLGQAFSYEGAPVAHRNGTNFFRTAFFAFTPLALQEDTAQIVVDSVLSWLFEDNVPAPVLSGQDKYPNAPIRVSASALRQLDAQATEQALQEKARKKAALPVR